MSFRRGLRYTSHSRSKVRIVCTVHLWFALLALFMAWPLAGNGIADYVPFLVVLTVCLAWHCALSAECYTELKKLSSIS